MALTLDQILDSLFRENKRKKRNVQIISQLHVSHLRRKVSVHNKRVRFYKTLHIFFLVMPLPIIDGIMTAQVAVVVVVGFPP